MTDEAYSKGDYSKGKIYRIWCITGESDDVYVGSTIQPLHQRWAGHKRASKTEKCQQLRLYQAITGNWDDWKIELIELYPCASRMELERREGEVIRTTGTLNTLIAGRTKKEYSEDNADTIAKRMKAYRQRNAEAIKEQGKTYYQQNTEVIKEKVKAYNQRNIEAIAEKGKTYRQRNAEAIKERKKAYYQRNAEALKEKKKQYRAKKKAEKEQQ